MQKLAIAAALALVAVAIPASAGPGDIECYYRDVACQCYDNHEQRCSGVGGDSCAGSIGPTPAIQIGYLCDANPFPTDDPPQETLPVNPPSYPSPAT